MSYSPQAGGDYDVRSLRHERRMLGVYRRRERSDGGDLQPLANACWRAGSFEWALSGDARVTRSLWAEGARALAEGFTGGFSGFDPSPDQYILALNLAVAGRDADCLATLAHLGPGLISGAMRDARAFRGAPGLINLAEGYSFIARALAENNPGAIAAAVSSLDAALEESQAAWWNERFPNPREARWLETEHRSVCILLGQIARVVARAGTAIPPSTDLAARGLTGKSASVEEKLSGAIDDAILQRNRFVDSDSNHHPKLYIWLPGLAVCGLAMAAGLPMNWLRTGQGTSNRVADRLPLPLLVNDAGSF